MRTITLTTKQTQALWLTLEELVNDDTKETYVVYGQYKHWERSAYISDSRVKTLRTIMQMLPSKEKP